MGRTPFLSALLRAPTWFGRPRRRLEAFLRQAFTSRGPFRNPRPCFPLYKTTQRWGGVLFPFLITPQFHRSLRVVLLSRLFPPLQRFPSRGPPLSLPTSPFGGRRSWYVPVFGPVLPPRMFFFFPVFIFPLGMRPFSAYIAPSPPIPFPGVFLLVLAFCRKIVGFPLEPPLLLKNKNLSLGCTRRENFPLFFRWRVRPWHPCRPGWKGGSFFFSSTPPLRRRRFFFRQSALFLSTSTR